MAGRGYARHADVEHTIHTSDGLMAEKNSYADEPSPPTDGR
ncbi:MAG: hypothetical protein ACJ796_16985 [Gemmatimonadaceae bacterium]